MPQGMIAWCRHWSKLCFMADTVGWKQTKYIIETQVTLKGLALEDYSSSDLKVSECPVCMTSLRSRYMALKFTQNSGKLWGNHIADRKLKHDVPYHVFCSFTGRVFNLMTASLVSSPTLSILTICSIDFFSALASSRDAIHSGGKCISAWRELKYQRMF